MFTHFLSACPIDFNKEDNCTGHFWESRYKSQALRTEAALLTCMAYVELNPIRAKMANTPEDSDYTSLQERITPTFHLNEAISTAIQQQTLQQFNHPLKPLLAFEGNTTTQIPIGIPFLLMDYLTLVDWTGRTIRADRAGHIPEALSPILERLGLSDTDWLNHTQQFEAHYRRHFARKIKSPLTG